MKLYISEEPNQVIFDGTVAEFERGIEDADPELVRVVSMAQDKPGKYFEGVDSEGCKFKVLVGDED